MFCSTAVGDASKTRVTDRKCVVITAGVPGFDNTLVRAKPRHPKSPLYCAKKGGLDGMAQCGAGTSIDR